MNAPQTAKATNTVIIIKTIRSTRTMRFIKITRTDNSMKTKAEIKTKNAYFSILRLQYGKSMIKMQTLV